MPDFDRDIERIHAAHQTLKDMGVEDDAMPFIQESIDRTERRRKNLETHRCPDGRPHSWRWDGDDPRIICCWCNEMRDAITGKVIPR